MTTKLKLLFFKQVLDGLTIIVWHHLQNMKDGSTKEEQIKYLDENKMLVRKIDQELVKVKETF